MDTRIWRHIILFFILTGANTLSAQVMQPAANANRSEMLIGEQAEISLSLELNLQNTWPQITFPYKQDTLVTGVEILEVTPVDTVRPDDSNPQLYQLRQSYTVTSFDSGYYALPPFMVIVNGDTLYSNRLGLAVNTIQIDSTQTGIFDIKPIYAVELTWRDYLDMYWWIGLLVLLGIVAMIFGYVIWKRRKNRVIEQPSKPEPKIPPHEIALSALRQLEAEKAWETQERKVYHTGVTDILRDYIEARYHVPAHEQTSNEILQNLRFADMSQDANSRLRHVLKLADMVKFAKEKPDESQNRNSLAFAVDFVEMTKVEELAEQGEKSAKGSHQDA